MEDWATLQAIVNSIDTLSTKEKTRLIEQVAVKLKQELISQNLIPRKYLKGLWQNSDISNGLILSAKHLNRITN